MYKVKQEFLIMDDYHILADLILFYEKSKGVSERVDYERQNYEEITGRLTTDSCHPQPSNT